MNSQERFFAIGAPAFLLVIVPGVVLASHVLGIGAA